MVDLVIRQRVMTTDPGTAGEAIAELVGTGTLHAGPDFTYEHRSLVDDGITVARISSRGDAALVNDGSADLILLAVRSGRLQLTCRKTVLELGEQELALIPFNEPSTLRWKNVQLDLFSFPLSSFVRTLGSPAGGLTIRARYLSSQAPQLTEFWFRLADLVTRQVLDRAEVYANDVVRAQLVDGLTAVTVEAFHLTNEDEEQQVRDDRLLAAADTYIQAHLHEPISIPEIAADIGISVRGLQVIFERRLDSTPIAHLRRARLEAARITLLNPGPGLTVGDVGRRVGYSNLGRFSAHYRDHFNESPSQTLNRTRAQR